jgi:sulfite reductase beta subunit-like hemoprotein
MRVTIPGGILREKQVRVLALVARQHGNGIIEITNRANVQLRGVLGLAAAARLLVDAGLSSGVPHGDRARAVLASPTAGVDVHERFDTRPIVRRLVEQLTERQRNGEVTLGPKFSVVVDGGGAVHVRDRRASERLVPGGLEAAPCGPPIGVVAARQPGRVWVGAAPALGRLGPDELEGLADLCSRFGDGEVRLTPWKGVVLAGVAVGSAGQLASQLGCLGLTTDPADPALRVIACAGSTGCEQGLADVQGVARRVIESAREHGARDLAPMHLSGCEKCCASRDASLVTFIATREGLVNRDGAALPRWSGTTEWKVVGSAG